MVIGTVQVIHHRIDVRLAPLEIEDQVAAPHLVLEGLEGAHPMVFPGISIAGVAACAVLVMEGFPSIRPLGRGKEQQQGKGEEQGFHG